MSLFIFPGDPLLNSSAEAVSKEEIKTKEIQEIIELMLAVARGERSDTEKSVMVGLAAPQLGISKRIILVDIGVEHDRKNLGQIHVFINPKIIWKSEETEEGREGCYSVDRHVAGIVKRAFKIKIVAFDREGNSIEQEFTGFTARIFQHEIDHLDGIRFPDRVGEEGVLHWYEEHQYSEYRKEWQNWPYRCPWNTWKAMREGILYKSPH